MRLLKRRADGSFSLTAFTTINVPRYAILSHTWDADDQEVTYQEITRGAGSSKTGYQKIEFCADQAKEDRLEYFWVDSCCIDKSNSSELTEAINSMYRWYCEAAKCYVYLSDVSTDCQDRSSQHPWDQAFSQSRWFQRGWTLQELLAPSSVEFFSQDGQRLGDKGTLESKISQITGIASQALQGMPMSQFSIEERMSWAADRQTTKEEDKAYSILGIFEVHMPLIYGEGQRNAFRRLREEIAKSLDFNESEGGSSFTVGRMEQFRNADERQSIIRWAFPSDLIEPHHQATTRLREATTGDWFLKGATFGNWKRTPGSIIWLFGNAGCGKTVLCSSIIEDIIFHCNPRPACYLAYFYFSFSDRQRQSVESFLRTVVRQLLQQRESVPDGVRDIYKKFKHAKPPLNIWIDALKALMSLEGDIFIIIDALDECPAHEGEQKLLLQTLQSLKQTQNWKIRLLVTSRKESSIEGTLTDLVTIPPLGIQTFQVDNDIRTHIQAQLQGHPNMRMWPKPIQEEVEQVLTEKSGGMFRWVACQLESLQLCRRIGEVKRTLQTLPETLDETYEKILLGIPLEYQQEAISALTWLVFAKCPLTIEELAEASVIDITSTTNKPFDATERLLDPGSIVTTLSGLVSVTKATSEYEKEIIRLAHFSVEEYLVSKRIMNSSASTFHLSYTCSARSLSGGCLYYLQCPNLSNEFPFFEYAAKYWPAHVKDCEGSTPSWLLDVMWSFFGSQRSFRFWASSCSLNFQVVRLLRREEVRDDQDWFSLTDSPLCYACGYGLADVVQRFLDIDAKNDGAAISGSEKVAGLYANELRVACYFSQEVVFFKLLDAGADHAHVERRLGTALGAAMHSRSPNEQIICRLLELSDLLPTSDRLTGSIMRWAVNRGNLRAVNLVLEKADVLDWDFKWTRPSNTFGGIPDESSYRYESSAPYEAAVRGHFDILQRLIGSWGYVNEADDDGRTALYWAAFHGHEKVVKLLLDNGAWANVVIRGYGWKPIYWAKERGNLATVELLEERGRDEPEHHVWSEQHSDIQLRGLSRFLADWTV